MLRSRSQLVPVFVAVVGLTLLSIGLVLAQPVSHTSSNGLVPIDVELPSISTGSPAGTLAVRVHTPPYGRARYQEGAPVLIWGAGGYDVAGINHDLPPNVDDIIVVTFVYPGGEDPWSGLRSDGVYDYRGPNCIAALRDVVRFAAGELTDSQGRTIDDIVPVPVLHENIGLIGLSNGGNTVVATAALFGADLAGHLRYIIQWETPVSSQLATRDLGRVWLQPPNPAQGDFFNPRYLGYGQQFLTVDYGDLTYDPGGVLRKVFHDGNGDGVYTTIENPITHIQTPDLNLDGVLDLGEDFPLDTYPYPDGLKGVYSRAVTQALADNLIVPNPWPVEIAMPLEADAYWDIRESVRLYEDALANVPDLEAMVLCGISDHVQSAPTKPHIQQALEGWLAAFPPLIGYSSLPHSVSGGRWVQINPSPSYLIEADPSLLGRGDLPDLDPNTPPSDWGQAATYCVPEDIHKSLYQLAAVWQMADRVQGVSPPIQMDNQVYLPISRH
jgi:hypothetical protein